MLENQEQNAKHYHRETDDKRSQTNELTKWFSIFLGHSLSMIPMERRYISRHVDYTENGALRKILCKKKSNQTLPVKRADREILLLIALFPEWERGMRASA